MGLPMDDRRRRFEAQVLPFMDGAYRFARWLARSPESADDLVQEAMLRAYRSFDTLRDADAKAWLMTIVRNCHFTAYKQAKRHATVPLPDNFEPADAEEQETAADPVSLLIKLDEDKALAKLIARLPDDYREVLVLREIEDMDYRQIAAVTCVPIGTVMSRLARARAALKEQWQSQEGVVHGLP